MLPRKNKVVQTAVIFEAGEVTFENLAIYAPNGSKYNYTVTEASLGDYETYAVNYDVEVENVAEIVGGNNKVDHIENLQPEQVKNEDGTVVENPTTEQLAELPAQATFYNVRKEKESRPRSN